LDNALDEGEELGGELGCSDRTREIEVPHVSLARWAIEKQAAESFF